MNKNQTTIECPICHKEHALFYTIQAGGKKTLNYLCNSVYKRGEDKYGMSRRYNATVKQTAEFVDGLPIREEWSPAYRKEWENKHNLQFPMTYGNR